MVGPCLVADESSTAVGLGIVHLLGGLEAMACPLRRPFALVGLQELPPDLGYRHEPVFLNLMVLRLQEQMSRHVEFVIEEQHIQPAQFSACCPC